MCSLPLRPKRHAISSADPAPKPARAVFLRLARRLRASRGPGTQLPWRRWPFAKRRKVAASRSSLIQRWSKVGAAVGFSACRQACLPKDISLFVACASQLTSISCDKIAVLGDMIDGFAGLQQFLASCDYLSQKGHPNHVYGALINCDQQFWISFKCFSKRIKTQFIFNRRISFILNSPRVTRARLSSLMSLADNGEINSIQGEQKAHEM